MKIKQDPVTGLWAREDGAVCMPPDGYKFKKFRWTFGCDTGQGYRLIVYKGKHILVHRIICRAFHGLPPADKPETDHINRIRDDNRPDNLRWASDKENMGNQDRVDQSVEKYGVRCCEDKKAYDKAHYGVHRENIKARRAVHDAAYYATHREDLKSYATSYAAEKRAQGLSYRKGPDGKSHWLPRIRKRKSEAV